MQRYFITKNILSCRLSSRLHIGYEHGLSYNGPLHRTPLWRRRIFWSKWPMTFLPGCMGGSLVLGLTAINVLGFYQKLFCRVVCHQGRGREHFMPMYQLDVSN